MNRKEFLQRSLAGAATIAVAGAPVELMAACTAKKGGKVELKLSFQEGIAPGTSLNEKLDYMENLGVVGFEPGGGNLAARVNEIEQALKGRNIKVSAICAGFSGFILAEDPAVKAQFDSTMRDIIAAAGELGSTGVIMVPAFNGQKPCKPHTMETRNFLTEQLHGVGRVCAQVRNDGDSGAPEPWRGLLSAPCGGCRRHLPRLEECGCEVYG